MRQEVHFCTASDGAQIAYSTVGEGLPLLKTANWLNHLEYDWESPVFSPLLRAIAADHRLIRYDARGNGLSDWNVQDLSFEAFVRDLETVVEAVGLKRFALLGISQGCAISIAYAVRHPERVSHLVLYGGFARGRRMRGLPEEAANSAAMVQLMRQGWGQENPAFRQMFTSLFIPGGTPEQMQWWNDLQRITTSPENAIRFREIVDGIEVSDLLPAGQSSDTGPALPWRRRAALRRRPAARRRHSGRELRRARGTQSCAAERRARRGTACCRNTRFYSNLNRANASIPQRIWHYSSPAGMIWMLDRTDLEPLFFAPFVSSVMRVEQSWIDYNGHLNMAYYNVLFDRCVDEAYELLGIGHEYLKTQQHSTFTAEAHVRYLRETARRRAGARHVPAARLRHQAHPLFPAAVPRDRRLDVGDLGEHDAARRHDGEEGRAVPREGHAHAGQMKAAHSRLPRPEAAGRRIAMPVKS